MFNVLILCFSEYILKLGIKFSRFVFYETVNINNIDKWLLYDKIAAGMSKTTI